MKRNERRRNEKRGRRCRSHKKSEMMIQFYSFSDESERLKSLWNLLFPKLSSLFKESIYSEEYERDYFLLIKFSFCVTRRRLEGFISVFETLYFNLAPSFRRSMDFVNPWPLILDCNSWVCYLRERISFSIFFPDSMSLSVTVNSEGMTLSVKRMEDKCSWCTQVLQRNSEKEDESERERERVKSPKRVK